VILPLGLLTAFRFGGFLKEPLTISENILLEAVSLNMEKPEHIIHVGDMRTRVYNEDVLANFTVYIDDYHANSWRYGSDYIEVQVDFTASTGEGFINYGNVTFWENYENSHAYFFGDKGWLTYAGHAENLTAKRREGGLSGCGLKAFVELAGVNNPKNVSFRCFLNWVLRRPQNRTNRLEVRFELIYFNGVIFKRIVQPFILQFGPDNNNSFETAEEIAVGKTYPKLYIGPNDIDDYYKVYLNEGQIISIQVSKEFSPVANFDLMFCNQDGKRVAYLANNYTYTVTYPINSSGYWFIRVHRLAGFGFYTLTLKAYTQGGG